MSLQLILGSSGSGKSSELIRMALERSAAEPDRDALIIVPEQYTMQTQKRVVSMHPAHAVINIDILSFNRLAYRVFDEVGEDPSELLGDVGKEMIVRRLLIEHRDELTVFKGNSVSQGFAAQTVSVISELMQYGISPEKLMSESGRPSLDARLAGKIRDIACIYKAFTEYISERYLTAEEIPDRLLKVADSSNLLKGASVFMDNFTGFTPVQYRLIAKMLQMGCRIVMTLPADISRDPYELKDKTELFYITKETISKLEKICSEQGVERIKDILLSDNARLCVSGIDSMGDLAALERNIFRDWIRVYHEVPEHISLAALPDPDSEMRFIAMKIREYIKSGMYRYNDIAVVTSDMEGCRQSAEYWFAKYDIPVFFDEVRKISGNMLSMYISQLLRMLTGKFSIPAVCSFLKSGLSGFSKEESDLLENYILAFGVRNYSRWKKVWTYGASEKRRGDYGDAWDMKRLNSLREKFISVTEGIYKASAKKKVSVGDMTQEIILLMENTGIEELLNEKSSYYVSQGDAAKALEYESIYGALTDFLNKTVEVLGDEKMPLLEYAGIISSGLENAGIGIVPPGIDQVTIGNLRRTRLDSIKLLFFAGMTEDAVPAKPAGKGLITDRERELLREDDLFLAPTDKENLFTERFYLYSVLTKPSEKLVITWPVSKENDEVQPSSVIKNIKAIFPELREIKNDRIREESSLSKVTARSMLTEGFFDLREGREPESGFYPVYRWMRRSRENSAYTQRLASSALYGHTEERLSGGTAAALYPDGIRGGVTMLERYARCPFAHFLTYGLSIDERKVYRIDYPDFGNILHQSLEEFSKRLIARGYSWKTVSDSDRIKLSDESVDTVASKYRHSLLTDNYRYAYLTEKIRRMMRRTTGIITAQVRKGEFLPSDYESRIELDLSKASIRGRLDRLDKCVTDDSIYVRVIDYKTRDTDIDYSGLYYGTQLQLFIYMGAAIDNEKKNEALSGSTRYVRPAGAFYYYINDPLISNDDHDLVLSTEGAQSGEISSALALKGLAVDDDLTISLMDADLESEPKILPLSRKRDGSLTARSKAVSEEDFVMLKDYAYLKAEEFTDKIMKGEINARPALLKGVSSCSYCALRSVCGFDPGIPGFRYRSLRSLNRESCIQLIHDEMNEGSTGGTENV
ncbi:MAG: PD-(D/E)XK nuclease family protein [Lachnospiraceae bacterium]|nr:PD-(D/E)XK nuclease family protein [Lachnospiraceae bacterium]